MRFVYIFVNDKIEIEIQKNRDKLSPFIRNKKIISNLYADLKIENDKRIFQYIKLLNQTQPPFEIGKDFLSSELIKIIEDSNFIFSKVNIKSSLKKLTNFSSLNTLVYKKDYEIISPKKLKIIIDKFYKDKVSVLFYFEFDEIEKDISINYDFQIPLVKSKEIAIISDVEKTKLLNLYKSIVNQDIMHSKYITIDKLNQLNENELINIQYKSESRKQKSVDFVSNTLFKMNIFDKDSLSNQELDFYYSMLENYLQNKNYIDYDDKIVLFNEEDIIRDIDNKTLLKVFSYNLNQDIRIFIDKVINVKSLIDKKELIEKLKSCGFNATLKNYQEYGVQWLYNLYKNNIDGGLLADEMGLGKTIQVIAFIILSKSKNNLIIAPASLVHNWKNEILKFTDIAENDISLSIENNSFITILSYEYVRSKIEILQEQDFDILIMDESQKIKNHKTQIFNAIIQIKRDFTIIMTGTPIENSLNDLWNMLFTINPSLHELYISKIQPLLLDNENYSKAIELTINMLYPIMLQRKKNEVLNLPNRDTATLFIEFTNQEEMAYKQLVNTFTSALKSGLSGKIQSIALEGLLRLRQYCSIHSIVPQSLLATTNLIDNKINKTMELIEQSIISNEKIIVFSQFTSSLDKLELLFQKSNYNYLRLDGSTTKINRNQYVEQFQNQTSGYDIFLISLKAGGVGLNLTSARSAILFEPWWNPAVEEQAFARIDRIGQLKTTKIYRLIYKDSIEEKISNLVKQKQGIFDSMSSFLSSSKNLEMQIAKDIFKMS
ncbi:DEAD/DEAH box helicase [Aliarcobacter butzleri]|uniref:DEAD/DEAH box helicase n=1 Tax=Aliarcobacter butzleri TaxID=28197 RepID=UPI00125EF7C5|nr:DEAD/DEAH box helicase [Aliarcobacter butzleri]